MQIKDLITGCFIFGAFLSACQQQGKNGGASNEHDSITTVRNKVMEDAGRKKEAYLKQLKAMSPAQLITAMEAESEKGREPYNSLVFAEVTSRNKSMTESLKASLDKPGKAALLNLLALRKIDKASYDSVNAAIKSSILTISLKGSHYFNTWGLPHSYWEDGGKAIIEQGRLIRPALIPLLSDTSQAPMWGSEEYYEYNRYKYRVCDYAMAFINEIDQHKVPVPMDVNARDSSIRTFLNKSGR
ncbi:hypothetical protein [Chitinophaga sp. MM2321]|uniref:hypothetical protein n=1 Tax=Chitinophaga sp. MM2321 TaxID=3137178 RepID=UPI0032D58086